MEQSTRPRNGDPSDVTSGGQKDPGGPEGFIRGGMDTGADATYSFGRCCQHRGQTQKQEGAFFSVKDALNSVSFQGNWG